MLNPDIEEIDLYKLCMALRARFGAELAEDYLDGRTLIRNAVVELLRCSALEAEELVDTLEAMRLLHFPTRPDETHSSLEVDVWRINVPS
jgi:hypothetical protein